MSFSDDLEAFNEWTNRDEDFREACVKWHEGHRAPKATQKASLKNEDCDIKWTEECTRFVCQWAKDHPGKQPGHASDWDGCFKKGRGLLRCANAKCISTHYSSVQKKQHPHHLIYREVFGI